LSKEDINELLGDLGTIGSPTKSDGIARLLRHPYFDPRKALAFLDASSLASLCRQRGLSDSGKRSALLARLSKAVLEESPDLRARLQARRAKGDPTWWPLLHPRIQSVAVSRFRSKNFADSVEAAFKDVNVRVKADVLNKGGPELDGADLMNHAFSPDRPIIVLGDQTTLSGRNEQRGHMLLFAGSMIGIRNPKAHANVEIEEPRAMRHLFFASLLMEKLDEAGVP